MKRTYENALKILESRRRVARPKEAASSEGANSKPEISSLNAKPNVRGTPSLYGMKDWLSVLDHTDDDIRRLNVIHIAGTKGKGSTCAFARSFLLSHGRRQGFPKKVGLYTSPHLTCIRERIQINDQPIREEVFTNYFFEIWDKLTKWHSLDEEVQQRLPRYLQLLALLAFHTFIKEGIEVAICETHHGGEYDATNVIQHPAATGITSLGMDHVAQLGPTIENIAWHKAGIMKTGSPAFSVAQKPAVSSVLEARAIEKAVSLRIVDSNPSLPTDAPNLQVQVQRLNCSLALALTEALLANQSPPDSLSLSDISQGIDGFSWPGRFETILEGNNTWYLDGAHNELSIQHATEWFTKCTTAKQAKNIPRVLIYSHFSEERDGTALLHALAKNILKNNSKPNYVIFTTYQEKKDGNTRIDSTLKIPEAPFPDLLATYSEIWTKLDPEAEVFRKNTVEEAIDIARAIGEKYCGMETLLTGSLHLVGGALHLLRGSL